MNSKDKGNIGEAVALAEFTKYGIQCAIPFGDNARYDLIAEFNGKLNKIQVKFCNSKTECDSYTCRLVSSKNHTTNKVLSNYTEDVDYMVFYIKELNVCLLVPIDKCKNQTIITFRNKETLNNQTKRTHLIKDYTFDKILCVETLHGQPKS